MKTTYMKLGLLTLIVSIGVTLNSCKKEEKAPPPPGIDLTKMDPTTSPKEVNDGMVEC